MKKRRRCNSNGAGMMMAHIEMDSNFDDESKERFQSSFNSSPGPRCSFSPKSKSKSKSAFPGYLILSSPIVDFGTTNSPSTPVDIKSVPQVRQLSCKKLIYSYTFGSEHNSNSSASSAESSPNLFTRSRSSSPTKNCRQQNYQTSTSNILKRRRYAYHHHHHQSTPELSSTNPVKRKH